LVVLLVHTAVDTAELVFAAGGEVGGAWGGI